jgi:small-conductance mechanosensitive channel
MPTPEQQNLAIILLALLGPKLVSWGAARFVSKKDEAEKKVLEAEAAAKHEKEEREKEETRRRDDREAAMSVKLDRIESSINDLKSDAREDRQRSAQLQGAVDKIEERINGVSTNHRPRLEALEQKVAVLEAAAKRGKTR